MDVNNLKELSWKFGERLKRERLRLGLSQEEFAAVGGVLGKTQSAYENGKRFPDVLYLLAVSELGIDLMYVLLNVRSEEVRFGDLVEQQTSPDLRDERDLIDQFRYLNEAGRASLQAFFASCSASPALTTSGTPRRAKRLSQEQRAALDGRTDENIKRAAELVRLSQKESELSGSLSLNEESKQIGPSKRAKRGVAKRRAELDRNAADIVDQAVNMRKSSRNTNETKKKS